MSYVLIYGGSSALNLSTLEFNHRNARTKWPDEKLSKFRTYLEKHPEGVFKWIHKPRFQSRESVETLEGNVIQKHKPMCNVDMDPAGSSRERGRDLNEMNFQGVYGYVIKVDENA